ncbi:MAG: MASE3 domain-containing protein [Promethearchaeota archaeon]
MEELEFEKKSLLRDYLEYLGLLFSLVFIFIAQIYSFLLFHSIAEMMSIIISGGIFIIGWNSRKYMKSSFFLVIGISFLYVAIIDLLHTLAYTDMNIFIGYNSNLPTSLWILARYFQAFSFLLATLVINRKIVPSYLFGFYTIAILILLPLIFLKLFPVCYIEDYGLTPFKIISEYTIISIFFISLIVFYRNKNEFDNKIFILMVLSIISTMISELAFTFYIGVFDLSNVIGHLFKILAFFFAYKAIIETGLENPFNLLFRKLKKSEIELIKKAQDLESAYSEFNQMFNASLPLRIIDKDYNIIQVNDTYTSLFNLNKDTIIGEKCFNLGMGHLCYTEDCSMKKIKEGKNEYEYELNTVLDDGTNIACIVKSVPYQNTKGDFVGIIQNFTNITEREKAESALKKSEERYRKIIEDSLEGVWVIDNIGKTTYVNNSMAKMFGYTIEDMIGKSFYEFMDEEGIKLAEKYFEQRRKGIKEDHDFEFLHKSGRKVYTTLRTSPIFDDSGNFNGAMAFVTDITDRKRAQEKIEDMAKLPAENPNPILKVSKNYVLLANRVAQKLFNVGEGSLIPKNLQNSVNNAFLSSNIDQIEIQLDNNIYSFTITPIKNAGYVNIYGLDITERKKAEESLERFVSTVSHELRTPISVLVMSMDFLNKHKEKITPEVENQLKDAISRNISLLNELVEDILTLSRIDEKKIKLDWLEYKPLEILNEILTLMEPIGKFKDLKFEINVDDNIRLYGDPKRIDQIFRIFIDNAIKYSKKGGTIMIKMIDKYKGLYNPKDKDGVLVQFIDYGIGISEEDKKNLFQRFFRSEQVSDIPGTGLGLAIAKELLDFHKANVFVDSELGKGTTFSIYLPRIKSSP